MNKLSKDSASWHEIAAEESGQRIDNYLMRRMKGVPKSHVYRILRSGEVRVNSGRIGPDYRLETGDKLRLPPVRVSQRQSSTSVPARPLVYDVLYEDDALLIIDKPAGLAVHGGSGVSLGAIEQLRQARPQLRFLELAHRLDRDTSGVLMLAKKRAALVALHQQLRTGNVRKVYLALVAGRWRDATRNVKLPLRKYVLASGERRVSVNDEGQSAHTIIRLKQAIPGFSLVEAELKTGRTHQIRVHLAHLGFPIAGDDKYGDFESNKSFKKQGLKRMFLHASHIEIVHPLSGEKLSFDAPLPDALQFFLDKFATTHHAEAV